MRKHLLTMLAIMSILVVLSTVMLIGGCSSKEEERIIEPPLLSNAPDEIVQFPEQGFVYPDQNVETLQDVHFAEGNILPTTTAVSLEYFILRRFSENTAKLYTYQIVASSNVTTRRNGNKDFYWDGFVKGYYLNAFASSYFQEQSIAHNYNFNLSGVTQINMYRTFNVIKPGTFEEVMFHVNLLKHENINNPQNNNTRENAFKLRDLITDYVTKTPQNYEYYITTAEYIGGATGHATLQWSDIQAAYYSTSEGGRVFYPTRGNEVPESMRPRDVIKIELKPISI